MDPKAPLPPPLIALLTDFGARDPFVGIMKGVIAQIAPEARLVDLTHAIPPGDILRAALALWQAVPYFPQGTVFLCVVDPGVGTSRRGVLCHNDRATFIGPDNGLFTFVTSPETPAWELANPDYQLPAVGSTFHGRDIFAPAAAHAALGAPPASFGSPVNQLTRLPDPRLAVSPDGALLGEVLYADRFGNLLTSLGLFNKRGGQLYFDPWLPGPPPMRFNPTRARLVLPDGQTLRFAETFYRLPAHTRGFVIGSSGLLEIAARGASALEALGLQRGAALSLFVADPEQTG